MTSKEFQEYCKNRKPLTKKQRLIGYNENLKRLNEARKYVGLAPVKTLS